MLTIYCPLVKNNLHFEYISLLCCSKWYLCDFYHRKSNYVDCTSVINVWNSWWTDCNRSNEGRGGKTHECAEGLFAVASSEHTYIYIYCMPWRSNGEGAFGLFVCFLVLPFVVHVAICSWIPDMHHNKIVWRSNYLYKNLCNDHMFCLIIVLGKEYIEKKN